MYLILGKPSKHGYPSYSGTDRPYPYYVDKLGDKHPANEAFFWFIDEGGESGIVQNLQKAKKLVNEYKNLSPPQYFEIVEISTGNESEIQDAEFLGFDISHAYHYSILEYFFQSDVSAPTNLVRDKAYVTLLPLITVMHRYFRQLINTNGLFSEMESADFFLRCMNAMTAFVPHIWEHPDTKFEIVKLWKIKT